MLLHTLWLCGFFLCFSCTWCLLCSDEVHNPEKVYQQLPLLCLMFLCLRSLSRLSCEKALIMNSSYQHSDPQCVACDRHHHTHTFDLDSMVGCLFLCLFIYCACYLIVELIALLFVWGVLFCTNFVFKTFLLFFFLSYIYITMGSVIQNTLPMNVAPCDISPIIGSVRCNFYICWFTKYNLKITVLLN